jgi:non-ribosomal peptide synthase protein (TIGR01720 family)
MRTAVERLMRHHDGLRQRVLLSGERTRARIAPGGDMTPFDVHDLTDRDTGEQDRELALIAERMQAGLNPSVGPLARFALIRLGERGDRIAAVVHRLAADAVSMDILLEDLQTGLTPTTDGAAAPLPAKTTSWQSWSRRLASYAKTDDVQSQREYWTALVGSPAAEIPLDGPDGREHDTAADGRTLTVGLDPAQTTDLLAVAPGALDCSVDELLLTALSRALSAWTGGSRHVVDLERHDRARLFEDVDLTRTAGWFSRTHPLALVCDPGSSPRATLGAVRRELQGVPASGFGWQLLRQDPDAVPAAPSDLVFGYRDRSGSTGFAAAARPLAGETDPAGRRPYALAVDASVDGGSLTVRWEYSERLHREQTVRDLADRFLAELRALIELAAAPRDGSGPEPADFPLARVDGAQLADLLGRL